MSWRPLELWRNAQKIREYWQARKVLFLWQGRSFLHVLENQNWHGIYSWQTWGIVSPYVPPPPQINIASPILAKTVFTYSLLKAGKHSWPYYWVVSISEMSSHAPMARCRIGVPMATVMCPIWLPLLIGMHGRNDVTLVMQYKGSISTMPWKLRRDI